MDAKYRSRKFGVTILCIGIASVMGYHGVLTQELSNVLLAAMASYNLANAWAAPK
jgi:hypothetical protein